MQLKELKQIREGLCLQGICEILNSYLILYSYEKDKERE